MMIHDGSAQMGRKCQMRALLVDHYDSFTNNVRDWLLNGGFDEVDILKFDQLQDLDPKFNYQALVFSPGPKSPQEIGPSRELLEQWLGLVPILGICLGHQLLGALLGQPIVRSRAPLHGSCRQVQILASHPLFESCPRDFAAGVYHSLVLDDSGLGTMEGEKIKILARDELGEIQAIAIEGLSMPALGLQFHPESFLTDIGGQLARNFYQCAVQSFEKSSD